MTEELKRVVANLRHAYVQLDQGVVRDQRQFANGLIAPQIRKLEAIITELEDQALDHKMEDRS